MNRTLYVDGKGIRAWLWKTCQVDYSISGLTELLHRLGFSYKLTTALLCKANAEAQTAFLTHLRPVLADVATGQAVRYYADAAHPTYNTRCTRAWCQTGKERPLLTVSGRERVNLNAALNAHAPLRSTWTKPSGCAEPQLLRKAAGGSCRRGPYLGHLRLRWSRA